MISLSRMGAMLLKEFRQLRRDRMTFGMIVMIPLIQLLLFGFAINTNIRHIPAGVVDQSQTALSRTLIAMNSATQVVEFVSVYHSTEEAESAIRAGDVQAVLIIPFDIEQRIVHHVANGFNSESNTQFPVSRPLGQWIVDGSDTMVAASIQSLRAMPLQELWKQNNLRATPTFEIAILYNPEKVSAINIVPGLIGVILTMTMILFTASALVREYERGNMEMLITTPIKPIEIMLAKILPFVIIGYLQIGIILSIGYWVFHVPFNGSILNLLIVTGVFITASLTLGLIISTIAKTQLQAMQLTVFVLLPSILLSGFMFPYEGMPNTAQWIAEVLPATHFMRAIRGVVLKNSSLVELSEDVTFLLCFTVIGLIVATLRFNKRLD